MTERIRLDVGLTLAHFEWNYYGRGAEARKRVAEFERDVAGFERALADARHGLAAAKEAEREEERRFAFRVGVAVGRSSVPPDAYVTSADDSDWAELVIPAPAAPT